MSFNVKAQRTHAEDMEKEFNPAVEYEKFITPDKEMRLIKRIIKGRAVDPCGRECEKFGRLIAYQKNHKSFKKFKELMNNQDFILEIAKITPNPLDCYNYFYMYVNDYIKANEKFRLQFLRNVLLNDNVYKMEHFDGIVNDLKMQTEFSLLLHDKDFQLKIMQRVKKLQSFRYGEYHCSGNDKKELKEYKHQKNDAEILNKNKLEGVKEIAKMYFNYDIDEQEKIKTQTKDAENF